MRGRCVCGGGGWVRESVCGVFIVVVFFFVEVVVVVFKISFIL